MKLQKLAWKKIRIEQGDTRRNITDKLGELGIYKGEFSNSTYVIRLSNTFIVEYERQKLSPVVYIGEGHIRARLNSHLGWLEKLSGLLPGANIEARFCFPKTESDLPAHEAFEAFLLKRFSKRNGRFPLKNRIHGLRQESIDFTEEKVAQILGHGTGNKYTWSIRPLPKKIPFIK